MNLTTNIRSGREYLESLIRISSYFEICEGLLQISKQAILVKL